MLTLMYRGSCDVLPSTRRRTDVKYRGEADWNVYCVDDFTSDESKAC